MGTRSPSSTMRHGAGPVFLLVLMLIGIDERGAAPPWQAGVSSALATTPERYYDTHVATAEGIAYVLWGGHESLLRPLTAIDPVAGKIRWNLEGWHDESQPPLVVAGRIYAMMRTDPGSGLHVVDADSGRVERIIPRNPNGGLDGAALVGEGFLIARDGTVIDIGSGTSLFALNERFSGGGEIAAGKFHGIKWKGPRSEEAALLRIDLATNQVEQEWELPRWLHDERRRTGTNWRFLGVRNGMALFLDYPGRRDVRAWELDAGRMRWIASLPPRLRKWNTRAFAGEEVVVVARADNGREHQVRIDLHTGEATFEDHWLHPALEHFKPEYGRSIRSVAAGETFVALLLDDYRLVCLEASTGRELWAQESPLFRNQTTLHVIGDRILCGEMAIVSAESGGLTVITPQDAGVPPPEMRRWPRDPSLQEPPPIPPDSFPTPVQTWTYVAVLVLGIVLLLGLALTLPFIARRCRGAQ